MKKLSVLILSFLLLFHASAFAQKRLKKSDRVIVSNVQAHTAFLNGGKLGGRTAGSDGEKLANEYIVKQFSKSGLKPKGEKDWYQQFNIYDGKEVKSSSMLKINDDALILFADYFPFAFSANKSTEASIAIALAENGVPWFKDLREVVGDDDSIKVDTLEAIRTKAKHAAEKGASALIIYNKSDSNDLTYDRFDTSTALDIPVLYLTRSAFKKYVETEEDIDVKLNVQLEEKNRTGINVIGFADNGADSTVVATAHLENATDVAALIEAARLLKGSKPKVNNYLFIAYCSEKKGADGSAYYKEHPSVPKVRRIVQIDTIAAGVKDPKELNLVKRSVEIIRNN